MPIFHVCRTLEQVETVRWNEDVLVEAESAGEAERIAKKVVHDPKGIRASQPPWVESPAEFRSSKPYLPEIKVVNDIFVEEANEGDWPECYVVEHGGTPQQTMRIGPMDRESQERRALEHIRPDAPKN